MRQTHIKSKVLSIALAFLIAVTMTPCWAIMTTDEASADECVAQIDEENYETLQAAIDAAGEDSTITLLKDYTVPDCVSVYSPSIDGGQHPLSLTEYNTKGMLVISHKSNPFTLDGCGKTVTGGITSSVCLESETQDIAYGIPSVTLKNINFIKDGTVLDIFGEDTTLTIESGRYTSTEQSGVVLMSTGGMTTISDGTFTGGTPVMAAGGRIDINGGTFTGTTYAVGAMSGGTVNISGGYFNGKISDCSEYKGTDWEEFFPIGTISITGGCFAEDPTTYVGSSTVTNEQVTDGEYTYNYIVGGTDVQVQEKKVIGGTFAFDPTAVVANGYKATKGDDEKWTVRKADPEVNYVAQIGDKKYETLQAAFNEATDGQTIQLIADSEKTQTTFSCSGKTVTLDLNGFTVSGVAYKAGDGSYTVSIPITVKAGTLIIDDSKGNGKIVSKEDTTYKGNYCLYLYPSSGDSCGMVLKNGTLESYKCAVLELGNASVTINGGKIISNGTDTEYIQAINNMSASLKINGGEFESNGKALFSQNDKAEVNGGYFKGTVDCKTHKPLKGGYYTMNVSAYVADGYQCVATTETDDPEYYQTYGWKVVEASKHYVAQIGDEKYESLADAVAAVPEGTDATTEIKMIENEVLTSGITIPATKNITLDLNGKTVSSVVNDSAGSALIKNTGILTIKDSSAQMNGILTTAAYNPDLQPVPGYANNTITNHGTLNVENGTIENTSSNGTACYAIDNQNHGGGNYSTLNISGGTINATSGYAIRMWLNGNNENNTTITGGTIKSIWVQDNDAADIGNLSISDATFTEGLKIGYANVSEHFNLNIKNTTFGGLVRYCLDSSKPGNTFEFSNNHSVPYFMDKTAKVLKDGTYRFDGEVKYGWVLDSEVEERYPSSEGWIIKDPKVTDSDGAWSTAYMDETLQKKKVEECVAPGYKLVPTEAGDPNYNPDGKTYKITRRVAEITSGDVTTGYPTLEAAIAAVKDGETIKILCDINDATGISVDTEGKTFTIDFQGHEYTVNKPGAGSTGTTTQAFQLIKGQNITFRNGIIRCNKDNLTPSSDANKKNIKRIIQNYADLTLENMTIDGTNLCVKKVDGQSESFDDNTNRAVIESACGNVNIKGSTTIIDKMGDVNGDVASINVNTWKDSYPNGTTVKVDTTGEIGTIRCITESDGTGTKNKNSKLEVENGKIKGIIEAENCVPNDVTVELKGGVYTVEPVTEYLYHGFSALSNTDEKTAEKYPYMVAEKQNQEVIVTTNSILIDNSGTKKADHIATLSGGGKYVQGNDIELIASEVENCTFVGWFKDEYTDTKQAESEALKYKLTAPTTDTKYVAVYRASSVKADITVSKAGNAKDKGNVSMKVDGAESATGEENVDVGAKAELTASINSSAAGTAYFICWQDKESKAVLSTNTTYQTTVLKSQEVEAKFLNEGAAIVNFNDDSDNLIMAEMYAESESDQIKDVVAVSKKGRAFSGWQNPITGDFLENEEVKQLIKTAANEATERARAGGSALGTVNVKAGYDNPAKYTVVLNLVNEEGTSVGTPLNISKNVGEAVVLTAIEREGGLQFKGFSNISPTAENSARGESWTYLTQSYKLTLNPDDAITYTYYAVYGESGCEIDRLASITMGTPYDSSTSVPKIGLTMSWALPEGATLVEAGFYYGYGPTLTVPSEEYKITTTLTDPEGSFTIDVNVTGIQNTEIYFAGYVKYKDENNQEYLVVNGTQGLTGGTKVEGSTALSDNNVIKVKYNGHKAKWKYDPGTATDQ